MKRPLLSCIIICVFLWVATGCAPSPKVVEVFIACDDIGATVSMPSGPSKVNLLAQSSTITFPNEVAAVRDEIGHRTFNGLLAQGEGKTVRVVAAKSIGGGGVDVRVDSTVELIIHVKIVDGSREIVLKDQRVKPGVHSLTLRP